MAKHRQTELLRLMEWTGGAKEDIGADGAAVSIARVAVGVVSHNGQGGRQVNRAGPAVVSKASSDIRPRTTGNVHNPISVWAFTNVPLNVHA